MTRQVIKKYERLAAIRSHAPRSSKIRSLEDKAAKMSRRRYLSTEMSLDAWLTAWQLKPATAGQFVLEVKTR